jgi:hypothetical protein
MNPKDLQPPVSPSFGFCLVAGMMAGYVAAVEISLLGVLIWTLTPGMGADLKALAAFSLKDAAHGIPYLLTGGVVGGALAPIILPLMSAKARQLFLDILLAVAVLGPFIHFLSSETPLSPKSSMFFLDSVLILGLGIAAYRSWFVLLQWLKAGCVRKVVWTVVAIGAGLWVPPLVVYIAIP